MKGDKNLFYKLGYSGPPLKKLEITVGTGEYDGTSNWVELMFRNKEGETCKTDYLNYKRYGFSFARSGDFIRIDANKDRWAASALAGCSAGNFRPDEELSVQVIVTRHGWNAHWDGYALSMIKATFGNKEEHDMETVWRYTTWNPIFCDGCNEGYSSWFQLNKMNSN